MRHIVSRANPLVCHFRRLCRDSAYRRERGLFLCEGKKLFYEAVKTGANISDVLATPDFFGDNADAFSGMEAVTVTPELLKHICDTVTPPEVAFVCQMPDAESGARLASGVYLILDGVQDPGNVGTMIRCADAFGLSRVFLLPGCADVYAPKVIRSTMGAVFRVALERTGWDSLRARLCEAGIPAAAAVLSKDAVPVSPAECCAVVIGSEARGVSEDILADCEKRVIIPMRGHAESLNAAMAASIILYEMTRGG